MISLSGALYFPLMRSPFGGLMLTPEMGLQRIREQYYPVKDGEECN
jgi:hypothetical protein